jgi:hypothetical protein
MRKSNLVLLALTMTVAGSPWHLDVVQAQSEPSPACDVEGASVPLDDAFITSIMHSQPVASRETQLRNRADKNRGSGRYINGSSGHLVPKIVGVRLVTIDDKSICIGGPVICELPGVGAHVAKEKTITQLTTLSALVNRKSAQSCTRRHTSQSATLRKATK